MEGVHGPGVHVLYFSLTRQFSLSLCVHWYFKSFFLPEAMFNNLFPILRVFLVGLGN